MLYQKKMIGKKVRKKMYVKKEKVYPAYVSKHNSNHGKQVILLMIPNGERWHYLAIKKL